MRTFANPFATAAIALLLIVASAAIGGSAAQATSAGQYIVVLKDGADAEAAITAARALGGDVFATYEHALHGYATILTAAELAAIRADSRTRFVAEDRAVTAAAQSLPFNVDRIDGELSSTRSGNGTGTVDVNIAVLDSGIYAAHPDLNVVGGVGCRSIGHGFADESGHGTAVAGIIGAKDNDTGVVGVAPGARLWAVRVLDKNASGTMSSVLCGVDWVTGTRTDDDTSNDIAVANMSLGGPEDDDGNCGRTNHDAVHLAICNSVAAGVTYVVAAMNNSTDFQTGSPANYDEVLTATAMWDSDGRPGAHNDPMPPYPPELSFCAAKDDTVPAWSNFATLASDQAHTLAAPGVCTFTTNAPGTELIPAPPDALYAIGFGGTSAAAPHITGTVALCIARGACAGLAPAQIIQKLRTDAATYNTSKGTGYGFTGDPLRPFSGKYFGYLVRAALY